MFTGVVVGLPSKVSGSEAEEEWQEVDWITWSTGDVSVDPDSFFLVFKPSDAGAAVKSKPLGSLVRASKVADETLVITTSDQLHRLYRFTFGSPKSAGEFALLAQAAEGRLAAISSRAAADSTAGADRAEAAKQLEADICSKFGDRYPLVYSGVELYGLDPLGEGGADEVLLGRGALALLDPPESETQRLGTYELHFYSEDEGVRSQATRFIIQQKMALRPPSPEECDAHVASFTLPGAPGGSGPHTITFDSATVAAAFNRDYRVRQRLMEVAVKTVKGARAASELRGQIEELKRQHILLRLSRLALLLLALCLVGCAVRLAMLYTEAPDRKPAALLQDLVGELSSFVSLSLNVILRTGEQACWVAFGSPPASEVRRCAALSTWEMKLCIDQLLDSVFGL